MMDLGVSAARVSHQAQDDRGISVADDSGDSDENLSHQGRGDQRNVGVLMNFQSHKMNAA